MVVRRAPILAAIELSQYYTDDDDDDNGKGKLQSMLLSINLGLNNNDDDDIERLKAAMSTNLSLLQMLSDYWRRSCNSRRRR